MRTFDGHTPAPYINAYWGLVGEKANSLLTKKALLKTQTSFKIQRMTKKVNLLVKEKKEILKNQQLQNKYYKIHNTEEAESEAAVPQTQPKRCTEEHITVKINLKLMTRNILQILRAKASSP